MDTQKYPMHAQVTINILGGPNEPATYIRVPYDATVAAPTVADLENLWGHEREEWGLMGPPAEDNEPLAIVRVVDDRSVVYRVERTAEDGLSYVALDRHFALDDLSDAIRAHHTGEVARPELDVLEDRALQTP